MLSRLCCVSLLFALVTRAYAEDAVVLRSSARGVSAADVTQWLLALLAVLAMFGLLVWLLRKSGSFTSAARSPLALIGGLSLGMRERLVLVKVGDKQLLLGVTPGRIEKLMELEGEQRLFQEQKSLDDTTSFAAKLQQMMQVRLND